MFLIFDARLVDFITYYVLVRIHAKSREITRIHADELDTLLVAELAWRVLDAKRESPLSLSLSFFAREYSRPSRACRLAAQRHFRRERTKARKRTPGGIVSNIAVTYAATKFSAVRRIIAKLTAIAPQMPEESGALMAAHRH